MTLRGDPRGRIVVPLMALLLQRAERGMNQFPPFLGGPFRWADSRSPADPLRALAARHGERYEPAAGLRDGRAFYR